MANYYYNYPSQSMQRPQPDGPRYQDPSSYPFSSTYQQSSQYGYGERYQDNPPPPQNEYRQNLKEDVFSTSSLPRSTFDHDASPAEEWMGTGVKAYRKGIRPKDSWTRGGGISCFGRFFFCSLLVIIYIIVAIILAFALWIRPPALSFTGPALNPNQQVDFNTNLTVPLELNFTVNNPNFFSVDFKTLAAEVSYPDVGNEIVAQGNVTDLVIKSSQMTNFTFPIDITLDLTSTGNDFQVVSDLASKCGIIPAGGQKSPIPLTIKIEIALSVLGIKVSLPPISFTVNINCPLDDSAIEQKLQGILGNGVLASL
ncbi:hypothetical protein GYMLUDRAFT_35947 [Collybiopsis luxurians FD-317 M1]|nr:hypothetical protein GYMLUDRAFT_35947 [Collybiopsis luxurians FD-317 M1]